MNLEKNNNKTKNTIKESSFLIFLLVLALLPNLIGFYYTGKFDLKLLFFSLFLVLIPFLVFKKKTALWVLFGSVLFSPFEIVTLFSTKNHINNAIIASIFKTNKTEASELIFDTMSILIFCMIFILVFIYILKTKITNDFLFKGKSKLIFGVTLIMIFISTLFMNDLQNPGIKQSLKDTKDILSYRVYPSNLIYNSAIYFKEEYKEQKISKELKNFKFHSEKTTKEPQIVVYVIGESSRAANWSLFGYQKETNPKLKMIEGLHIFNNILSCANSTFTSMPMLLSRSTPDDSKRWHHEGNLMQLFKESGYYTAWIGGQSKGHVIVRLANLYADKSDYYEGQDRVLFENTKEIIEQQKDDIFIVVHTMGSHYDYQSRYPDEFKKFIPTAGINSRNKDGIVNAYDNSVLYTDYLLADLIHFLNNDKRPSVVFYTSDHGENLMDDERELLLHVQAEPTLYELHVPMFVWTSEKYSHLYPEKVDALSKNINKKNSTDVSFETLSDLGHIKYNNQVLEKALSSESFKESESRFYLSPLNQKVKFD